MPTGARRSVRHVLRRGVVRDAGDGRAAAIDVDLVLEDARSAVERARGGMRSAS